MLEKNVGIASENTVHEDSDSGVVFSEAEFGQHKVNRSVSGVREIAGWGGNTYLSTEDIINAAKRDTKTATYDSKAPPCDQNTISNHQNTTSSFPNTVQNDSFTDPSDLNAVPSDLNTVPSDPSKRVFLNHRSVTRLKDIKYKRISKTKSKSMEELRDKLRDSPFLGQDTPKI